MAHKTLVGGTAYEISGGKPLVNGTAYSIDKGKTLVGGTAYEVGFAPDTVRVYFPNGTYQEGGYHEGNNNYVEVSTYDVDGTWEGNDLIVPAGTELTLWARGTHSYYISVDIYGKSYTVTEKDWSCPFTVTQNTVVDLGYDYARITEIPEGHALVEIAPYSNYAYFVIDGTTYNSGYGDSITRLVVPIGAVVTCKLATQDDKYAKPYVLVNGANVVVKDDWTYDYTVVGNATLTGFRTKDKNDNRYGYITITET